MAQAGNVWEWEETDADLSNNGYWDDDPSIDVRGIRGASWRNTDFVIHLSASGRTRGDATYEGVIPIGFRVASLSAPVPEPDSLAAVLGMLGTGGLFYWRRGRR